MSLILRDFCSMSYGNGMTFWGYRTQDTRRELEGSIYWKDAAHTINIGDFIFVHHIGRGNAIYIVTASGLVRCMTEWPKRQDPPLGSSANYGWPL